MAAMDVDGRPAELASLRAFPLFEVDRQYSRRPILLCLCRFLDAGKNEALGTLS
jgi:hypothetical protein